MPHAAPQREGAVSQAQQDAPSSARSVSRNVGTSGALDTAFSAGRRRGNRTAIG